MSESNALHLDIEYIQRSVLEKLRNMYKSHHSHFDLDKQLSQSERIKTITNWYQSQKLVFVLGAGASTSYNLPSWNALLQKLFLITLKSDDISERSDKKSGVLAKTFSNIFEPSSLISARYLHNYFKKVHPRSNLAFETAIRDALYDEIETDEDSELLKEIRQFCIAAGKSPNLDSIITYNYDDLLERCLKNLDIDIPFIPIHARGMKHNQDQLPIYHVHGYLPRNGQLTFKNKVILSEDGYHQQYNDVYGWSNLVQINKFKDYNCVFIGLSFTDPNLRRLLDIAKNERGDDQIHHYCFKKRYDKKKVQSKLEMVLSENHSVNEEKIQAGLDLDDIVKELISLMERFEENDALSFGVGVLWVNDYDEIPSIIKKVRLGQ